jgi:hypothetical protein
VSVNGVEITGDAQVSGRVLANSSATRGGLNIAQSAAPSTPQDGDFWVESTGVFARRGGVTVQLDAGAGGSIGGSIAANQVAFGLGTNTIQGSANLTFDGTDFTNAAGVIIAKNIKRGTGTPEGVVTGSVGDIFQRTDGGTSTTLYVKESGAGNTGWVAVGAGGGGGTVTSVGLSLPSIFSVSGSPVTTSGTLTGTLTNQAANLVFAGPTSGGLAVPTFRALVAADLPAGTGTILGTLAATQIGYGSALDTLAGDATFTFNSTSKAVSFRYGQLDTGASVPALSEGRFYYDSDQNAMTYWNDVQVVHMGQESVALVRNSTGSTIAAGKVVYISGATGFRPNITLATNANSTGFRSIGIVTVPIANNSDGYVVTSGIASDVNTSAFSDGDMLWLTTSGTLTATQPTSPANQIRIGTVARAHPTLGKILVNVDVLPALTNISDVTITSPTTGDLLRYNGTLWVNSTLSAAGIIGGTIAVNQVAFGSGANTIQGSANLTFDGSLLTVNTSIEFSGTQRTITHSSGPAPGSVDGATFFSTGHIYIGVPTGTDFRVTVGSTLPIAASDGLLAVSADSTFTVAKTTGQTVTIRSTTASTTTLTGAVNIGDGSTVGTNVGIGGGNIVAGAAIGSLFVRIGVDPNVSLSSTTSRLNVYEVNATSTTLRANIIHRIASNGSGADTTLQFTDSIAFNSYISQTNGNLHIIAGTAGSNSVLVDNSTTSTSTTTGAFVVTGGAGINGDLFVGNGIHAGGGSYISGSTSDIALTIQGSAPRISWNHGGATVDNRFWDSYATSSGTFVLRALNDALNTASIAFEAVRSGSTVTHINFPETTSATSSTVGSITIGNGVAATSVAIGGGNIFAGGKLTLSGGANSEIFKVDSTSANGVYQLFYRSGTAPIIFGHYSAVSGGGGAISADAMGFRSTAGIGFMPGSSTLTMSIDTSGVLTSTSYFDFNYSDNSDILAKIQNYLGGTTSRAGLQLVGALGYNTSIFLTSDTYAALPALTTVYDVSGTRAFFSCVTASLASNRFLDADSSAGTVISGSLYKWTFGNKVTTIASASGGAGFNLPHGAVPSSPVDGDLWTTTTAAFVRINGATVQLGSGTIGGSIASNQVAYGSGTNTITGSANLTWNGSTLGLTGAISQGMTITDPGADVSPFLSDVTMVLTANNANRVMNRAIVRTSANAFNYTAAIGLRAVYGSVIHAGTGTVTGAVAGNFDIAVTAAGNMTNAFTIRAGGVSISAAGVIATARGIYLGAPQISGGGAITTYNALEIEPISGAGTNRAIYTQGAGLVVISDTTDASAIGTASVVLSGGLSVAKQLRTGGAVTVLMNGSLGSPAVTSGALYLEATGTTFNPALVCYDTVNLVEVAVGSFAGTAVVGTVTAHALNLRTTNANRLTIAAGTGDSSFTSTTASTNTSTGAVVIAGGLGVAGAANVGTVMGVGTSASASYILNLSASNSLTGTTQGGNIVFVRGSSAATTMVVGVSVAAATQNSAFTCNDVVTLLASPIVQGGASTITRVHQLALVDPNAGTNRAYLTISATTSPAVYTGSYAIYSASTYGSSFAGLVSILDSTDAGYTAGAAALFVAGGLAAAKTIRSTLTTAATNTITGALIIGDQTTAVTNVGIGGGNIYAGGRIFLTDGGAVGTPAYSFITNNTSGITYASGVAICEAGTRIATFANGAVTFSTAAPTTFQNTTASTSTSTGAVIISGGVGISGDAFVGGGVHARGGSYTTGATSDALITVQASIPRLGLNNGAATANNRFWDVLASSAGVFVIRAVDDALSVATSVLEATRSGSTVTVVNFPETTSATSSTVGSVTVGNGVAATNVAIGGGIIIAGTDPGGSNSVRAPSFCAANLLDFRGASQIKQINAYGTGDLELVTRTAGDAIKIYTGNGALAATFGSTQQLTVVSTIIAPAATTSISSVRLPHGTAPSSPTNGDVWTTTAGMFAQINGSTVGPFGAGGGTIGGSIASNQVAYGSGANTIQGSANFTYDGTTATIAGRMGIGGAGSSLNIIAIGATNPLSGVGQTAVGITLTGTSGGTSAVVGVSVSLGTSAVAYTASVVAGVQVLAHSLGSTSTITRAIGAYLADQTVGTNNATLLIGPSSTGFTGTYAIYSGNTNPSLFSGSVLTSASSTSRAGLNIPHGTAPSSPTDGDLWTTSAGGLFARINGVTVNYTAGGGTIGGSIASGQVAFGSGTNTIQGSATLTYTATTGLTLAPTAVATGVQTAFLVTGAANTNMTASTEVPDVNFNFARTVQWATGALTTQRAFLVQAPTYAFVGASTITTAATFAISGAPTAGTNATITNRYAFWVMNGISSFGAQVLLSGSQGVVTGSTAMLDIAPTSAAGNGTPRLVRVVGTPNTGITASTEVPDIDFSLNRTVQWATGTLTTQRAFLIQAPTYAFVGVSTINTAATFAITGAPASGSNAIINNAYTMWAQSGRSQFDGQVGFGGQQVSATTGQLEIAPSVAATSGTPKLIQVTAPANTGLSASSEVIDVLFGLGRAVQWATGNITSQRAFVITAPIYSFVAASTITNAATFAITGAPVASTNATITNTYALWVQAGISNFDDSVYFRGPHRSGTLGQVHIAPTASGVGTPKLLVIVGAASTGNTASTEVPDVDFNLSRTVQWSTGALTTQRAFVIRAPTYAFVGASTITTAATLSVTGAPAAGTNATITRGYAIRVEAGQYGGPNGSASLPTYSVGPTSNDTGMYNAGGAVGLSATGTQVLTASTSSVQAFVPYVALDGSASAPGITFTSPGNSTGIYYTDGIGFSYVGIGGMTIGGSASQTKGIVDIVSQSYSSAATADFRVAAGAHTAQTASTEASSIIFDLSATKTWAGGALTTQRAFRIAAPTYAFVSSSTITNAATVAISGAPAAGSNATITTSYALWIESGLLGTAASTTTVAGLRVPHGTAPSSPTNGDVWTTTAGMFARINGTTVGPFGSGGGTIGGSIAADQLAIGSGTNTISGSADLTYTVNGGLVFNRPAVSGGAPVAFSLNCANHTNNAASTEVNDVRWDFLRTVQWATGALTTQRAFRILQPTYAFVGASTITTAATVSIGGAPVAGTNATITTSVALDIESGLLRTAASTTSVSGFRLPHGTAPTSPVNGDVWTTTSGLFARINSSTVGPFGSGTIGGSISAEQIAFGSGVNTIQGSSELLYSSIDGLTLAPTAQGSGTPETFTIIGAANGAATGNTASTEVSDVNFALNRSVRWAAGTLTTQRFFSIKAPTITFASASTATTAATVAIDNAPQAGTNATITNAYALWVQAGNTRLQGNLTVTGTATLSTASISTLADISSTSGQANFYSATSVTVSDSNFVIAGNVAPGKQLNFQVDNHTGNTLTTFDTGAQTSSRTFTLPVVTGNDTFVTRGMTQTLSGINTFSNTTASTNKTSGAVVISGGVGIAGRVYLDTIFINPAAIASGTAANMLAIRFDGAAHTLTPASTELLDAWFNLARTVQFATTTPTTQRAVLISAPTYACSGAGQIITTAATFAIEGPAAAGTNVTITNPYALWVQSGKTQLDGPVTTGGTLTVNTDALIAGNGVGGKGGTLTSQTSGAWTFNCAIVGTIHNQGGAGQGAGGWSITQSAGTAAGGGTPMLRLIGGAHTGALASTEYNSVLFNFSATQQFNTGALTTQRCVLIMAPTYGFVGASTITTAATFAIDNAPAAGTNATLTNSYALWVQAGRSQFDGSIRITQPAGTGSPQQAFIILGGAHTSLTASTEIHDVNFSLDRTVQWATGAITTQRAFVVAAPTYAFVGTSTITSAATFAITGAPVAGTNATLTNSYALWVQAGRSQFNGAVLSNNATAGIGYSTGAGGAVTQITSRTTGVTLNTVAGAITLFTVAPTLNAWVSFTVTNSAVAATDTIVVSVKSGTNTYIACVSAVAAGSFRITFASIAGTASDAPVINFAVVKAVAA